MNEISGFSTTEINEYYVDIFKKSETPYEIIGQQIVAGNKHQVIGWMIMISSIPSEVDKLIKTIVPILLEHKISIEIPLNYRNAKTAINGSNGYSRMGIAITIFPENDHHANEIIEYIKEITSYFNYTEIPQSVRLFNNIFVRRAEFTTYPLVTSANNLTWLAVVPGKNDYVQDLNGYEGKIEDWPFSNFLSKKPKNQETSNLTSNGILVTKKIRESTRANVSKGIFFNSLFPKRCIIKSGHFRHHVNSNNRDAQDNIEWQYKIINKIKRANITNKPFTLIRDEKRSYLVTNFLKGKDLNNFINQLYNIRSWRQLSSQEQSIIINVIVQCISTVVTLHQYNLVHRDISHGNFLFHRNHVKIIDFGLCYDLDDPEGSKASYWGKTIGFGEKDKNKSEFANPEKSDDIYSLGCLILFLITGVFPSFIVEKNKFINSENSLCLHPHLYDIIKVCIDKREQRPTASELFEKIQKLSLTLQDNSTNKSEIYESKTQLDNLKALTNFSIANAQLDETGIWASIFNNVESGIIMPATSKYKLPWISSGVAGILLSLSDININDPIRSQLQSTIRHNAEYLVDIVESEEDLPGGLFSGVHGISLALAYANKNGMLDISSDKIEGIYKKYSQMLTADLTLNGLAGIGLAAVMIEKLNNTVEPGEYISSVHYHFFENLQSFSKTPSSFASSFSDGSLANGAPGIIFSLLKSSDVLNDNKAKSFCDEQLIWLCRNSKYYPGNRSLLTGNLGLVSLFLNAYKTLKEPRYLQHAQKTLENTLKLCTKNDLSYGNGLAGLGHILLDIYHISGNERWLIAAIDIRNYFEQLLIRDTEKGYSHWFNDITQNISMDYFYGNGGMISFYNRIINNESTNGFHLLE